MHAPLDKTAVLALSGLVLTSYYQGRCDVAAIAMTTIHQVFGREGLYCTALSWCDNALYGNPGYERGAPVYLAWEDVDTGRIGHADDVPPTTRWAGRLLAARAADDEESFNALFSLVPDDELGAADHMSALLWALWSHHLRAEEAS